jgi:hypothetical protein
VAAHRKLLIGGAEKLNRLTAARIVEIANRKVIDDPQFEPCGPHLAHVCQSGVKQRFVASETNGPKK